jgi:hypothetical protein
MGSGSMGPTGDLGGVTAALIDLMPGHWDAEGIEHVRKGVHDTRRAAKARAAEPSCSAWSLDTHITAGTAVGKLLDTLDLGSVGPLYDPWAVTCTIGRLCQQRGLWMCSSDVHNHPQLDCRKDALDPATYTHWQCRWRWHMRAWWHVYMCLQITSTTHRACALEYFRQFKQESTHAKLTMLKMTSSQATACSTPWTPTKTTAIIHTVDANQIDGDVPHRGRRPERRRCSTPWTPTRSSNPPPGFSQLTRNYVGTPRVVVRSMAHVKGTIWVARRQDTRRRHG